MTLASRLLVFAALLTAGLVMGHHSAAAAPFFSPYANIETPAIETQISLTDDQDWACHAAWSNELTTDQTIY